MCYCCQSSGKNQAVASSEGAVKLWMGIGSCVLMRMWRRVEGRRMGKRPSTEERREGGVSVRS